ncbi:hypothetical protein, partial [Planktothrix sp.]|uniref:hypothetical protein n=1 Tax=Planktothrix sp. TaxID=3088171 RepID=UPI0038D366BD
MSNQEIRQIIDKNQAEIQAAFKEIIDSVGANLEPDRKASMGNEFQELNEFLEKLKTGFIYVALFGKPGAGKSSI